MSSVCWTTGINLFRTAEGLCRKFAKHGASRLPWGGRHVIMLGDPAQLPAVGRSDLFGTHLWRTFSVLVLREIKRSQDPVLTSVLTKSGWVCVTKKSLMF